MNGVIPLVTSLLTLLAVVLNLRQGRGIHKMVNGAAQAQTDRIDQLTQTIQKSDKDIPPTPPPETP